MCLWLFDPTGPVSLYSDALGVGHISGAKFSTQSTADSRYDMATLCPFLLALDSYLSSLPSLGVGHILTANERGGVATFPSKFRFLHVASFSFVVLPQSLLVDKLGKFKI